MQLRRDISTSIKWDEDENILKVRQWAIEQAIKMGATIETLEHDVTFILHYLETGRG